MLKMYILAIRGSIVWFVDCSISSYHFVTKKLIIHFLCTRTNTLIFSDKKHFQSDKQLFYSIMWRYWLNLVDAGWFTLVFIIIIKSMIETKESKKNNMVIQQNLDSFLFFFFFFFFFANIVKTIAIVYLRYLGFLNFKMKCFVYRTISLLIT